MYAYEFDYRKAFDDVTRAWARERLQRYATAVGCEHGEPKTRYAGLVIADINNTRHAYRLPMLSLNSTHDDIQGA